VRLSARTIAIVTAGLAALLTLWLWPKPHRSPEEEIRALVATCVKAAEDKDLGTLTEAIAEDFKGPSGSSRDDVKRILAFHVLRDRESVAVFNPLLTVNVTGDDTGEISGKFVFARAKAVSFDQLPDGSVVSAYEIDAKLQKRDNKWRFVSATYKQQGF
jgi:hypothetical protein